MEAMMAEMPLTIFTTLAPVGSGAFAALAIALLIGGFDDADRARLCRLAFVPLGVVAVAFAAAFFHLASPLHAFWVLFGIRSSPMSNEIAAGVAFAAAAFATVAAGATGRVGERALTALFCVSGALGLAFSWLVGAAYAVDTVATWSHPALPFVAVGCALCGGALLAVALLSAGGFAEKVRANPFKTAAVACIGGAVLAVVCTLAWYGGVVGTATPLVDGAARAGGYAAALLAAGGLVAASAALGIAATVRPRGSVLPAAAVVLLVAGVFVARVAFYALEISVGL